MEIEHGLYNSSSERLSSKDVFRDLAKRNVIMLGPPGAGKTTLIQSIKDYYTAVNYISVGDISRNLNQNSDMGRRIKTLHSVTPPSPWPAELVLDLVASAMINCNQSGFFLDGMPRKIDEALLLKSFLSTSEIKIDLILELYVDSITALQRINSRLKSGSNARVECLDHYNIRLDQYFKNIDAIINILRDHNIKYCFIDTGRCSIEDILAELEGFLRHAFI